MKHTNLIKELLSQHSSYDIEDLYDNTKLSDLGMDSLSWNDFIFQLEDETGWEIDGALVFDLPKKATLEDLIVKLHSEQTEDEGFQDSPVIRSGSYHGDSCRDDI